MTIEEAYRTKRQLLLYSAHKYVGALAEDIVQTAFLKLLTRYGTDDIPYLENILFLTLRNECINHNTHSKIINKYLSSVEIVDEYALINIEFDFVSLVYKKLDILPKKCRHIFELFYFEDLAAPDIAKILGIKTTSVTSQLQRGRDLLRPYFT